MSNSQATIDPEINVLIEKPVQMKEVYGDNYPIIWYDPEIETEAKKSLKDFIQDHKFLHSFRFYLEALQFAQSLGISFIFIIFSGYNEQKLFQDFKCLEMTYGRRMSKFEEERLLEVFIEGTSDGTIKTNKVYVFSTLWDSLNESAPRSEEKDITVMGNLDVIPKDFQSRQYLHDVDLILYDPTMNIEIREKLVQYLETEIQEKNIYTDLIQLQKINETGPPYHLIIAGKELQERVITELANPEYLLGLYIYHDGARSQRISNEKVDIARTLEELLPQIKEGIRRRSFLQNGLPVFATNFDVLDRSYLYYLHHYLKGLTNFGSREQAKQDFINLALKVYSDRRGELFKFKEEYNQYSKKGIFGWYTRDSPIYKLINNCLRIASSDSILYCRLILKDLERAITEQYQAEDHSFTGLVYRGAFISVEEWKTLQKNIGQEIEMYGFLSTTRNKKVAINFIRSDMRNKVFITIIVPPLPELDGQGFANINKFTSWPNEKEILFNVRSKFKILRAESLRIDDNGTKVRHLVLFFGAQLLRKYMTENQPCITIELKLSTQEILKCMKCGSGVNLFGFQQARTQICCFECLIKKSIPHNIPMIALDGKNTQETVTKFKI